MQIQVIRQGIGLVLQTGEFQPFPGFFGGLLVVERSPEADVAVIDNGSTEPGTLEWLKSEHPSVTVIALERNLGYAGGYQEGLRQLEGYDLAVLMNTDIEPLEGWLAPLTARFAKQPRLGAIQPKLRSHAHFLRRLCCTTIM